ncbi:hypothetical protein AAH013_09075 [Phocaeicola dorei]|nr:hypothetical protein [Phocaeicola dorei]EEZ19715.1 hypothetical protein HMPREF0105_3803 [Bacteroides sp. 3_1_33FAA]
MEDRRTIPERTTTEDRITECKRRKGEIRDKTSGGKEQESLTRRK